MKIDSQWTLFLDRDGVINELRVGEYIHEFEKFIVREDFWNAAPQFFPLFKYRIVITNQQGVTKGLCTMEQVDAVHEYMQSLLAVRNLKLDAIYCCPHLEGAGCGCRKPDVGMALMAKRDFPDIDFGKSLMIGDSFSDMKFGRNCGMKTAMLTNGKSISPEETQFVDFQLESLTDLLTIIER